MSNIDWNSVDKSFERHEKFGLEVGAKAKIVFLDDGTSIEKEKLKNAQFPRDFFIFLVDHAKTAKEWWISQNDFGTMRQLKEIRSANGDTLAGAIVDVERISRSPKQPNWKVTKAK